MSKKETPFFGKRNYTFMLIGILLIALGFVLMYATPSTDTNVFNPEIFNFQRIRLAPFLIILGFVVEVYAILTNPNKK